MHISAEISRLNILNTPYNLHDLIHEFITNVYFSARLELDDPGSHIVQSLCHTGLRQIEGAPLHWTSQQQQQQKRGIIYVFVLYFNGKCYDARVQRDFFHLNIYKYCRPAANTLSLSEYSTSDYLMKYCLAWVTQIRWKFVAFHITCVGWACCYNIE